MVDSICWNMPMSSPVEPGLYSSSGKAYFATRVEAEASTLAVSKCAPVFNVNLRLSAVCAGQRRSAPAPTAQRTWQRRGPDSPPPARVLTRESAKAWARTSLTRLAAHSGGV